MDGAAAVGQFLREVSLADLVVELVQNDLDAGATSTSINFGKHGLLCEGDGEPRPCQRNLTGQGAEAVDWRVLGHPSWRRAKRC